MKSTSNFPKRECPTQRHKKRRRKDFFTHVLLEDLLEAHELREGLLPALFQLLQQGLLREKGEVSKGGFRGAGVTQVKGKIFNLVPFIGHLQVPKDLLDVVLLQQTLLEHGLHVTLNRIGG